MNVKDLSTEEIINKINQLRNSRPGTINGIRGASMLYELLHRELDRRRFTGGRPSRIYTPSCR